MGVKPQRKSPGGCASLPILAIPRMDPGFRRDDEGVIIEEQVTIGCHSLTAESREAVCPC